MFRDNKIISMFRPPNFWFTPGAVTMIIAVVAAMFVFAYLTSRELKRRSRATEGIALISPECLKYESDVNSLRTRYVKLTGNNESTIREESGIAIAQELLLLRRKMVGACASGIEDDPFYSKLEISIESYHSDGLFKESSEAEARGREALSRGDESLALRNFTKALRAQKRINDEHPIARQASINRESVLNRFVDETTYEPILKEYKHTLSEADDAFLKQDYTLARDKYQAVLSILHPLSYSIPSSYMDVEGKVREIGLKLMDTLARIRNLEIDRLVKQAIACADADNYIEATQLFAQALEIQQSIAKDYPKSEMAGDARMEALDRRRQNVISRPLVERLDKQIKELNESLRNNDDAKVQSMVSDTIVTYSELSHNFPLADVIKEETYKRIQYLYSIRADICLLHRAVMEHLLPLPDNQDYKMLDREVSQQLFSKICGSNPSARKQDDLPVEGVTLKEINTFTQRLTWIVGSEVRLPYLADYLSVMHPVDGNYVRKDAWNSVTASTREPRPVATSKPDKFGFYDLFGNVSEWVAQETPEAKMTVVIGGSVRDNPIRMCEIPQDPHEINERIRNTGFRIIVNTKE